MQSPIDSSPAQSRQTKQQFANREEYLSYELGKAVKELPPLYTRLLAGTISLLLFSAIAWAHFSQVDEVATAAGELVPNTQVRPVRSLGGGTVVAVKVKEGEHIQKDQVLIERDPSLPQTDVNSLTEQAKKIQEDLDRLEAERTGATTAGTSLQDQLLSSRAREFSDHYSAAKADANSQIAKINGANARLSRLQENFVDAQVNQANAETNLVNTRSLFPKAQENLTLAQKRVKSMEGLLTPGAVTRNDLLDAQERLIRAEADVTRAQDDITKANDKVTEAKDKVKSLQKDIDSQKQEINQAEQGYQSASNQAARIPSERQTDILTQINKRKEELTTVVGKLEQAKKQRQIETITAPVSGTIYSVKATKGPVQQGEELLSILPEGEDLVLEVKVLNRDIGFIAKKMKAKVKMATFPYQEFGTIEGEVVEVSPNAIIDKDLGLVFPTRIKISRHSIRVRGEDVPFTPGMSASGEIITGKKSILTFLIEPISRRFNEAFSIR